MKDIASSEKSIIIEYLQRYEVVTANDDRLIALLGHCSTRKLNRLLNFLTDDEGILAKSTASRPYKYRLKDKSYIIDVLSQKEATDLHYALEFSSEEFSQDSVKLIERIFSSNNDAIDGHLASFEDFKDTNTSQHYNQLLDVIKQRYYTKLTFQPNHIYEDTKCIKMLFLDNNWYVAFEFYDKDKNEKKFRLGRLSFLKSIELLKENRYSSKNTFQKKDIGGYLEFINGIQNSLTLYGVKPKIVKVKVLPQKAHYFEEGMKKFLHSQKFLKKNEDGSVIISVEYTQPLEILPFIQQWMPHMTVENGEIQDILRDNLKTMKQILEKTNFD